MPFVPQLALLKKRQHIMNILLVGNCNFTSFYVSCKVFQNKSVLFFMNLSLMDRQSIAFLSWKSCGSKYSCLYKFAQLYE